MRPAPLHPDLWLLKQIRWQFFLTLTFASDRLAEPIRQRKARSLFNKAADRFGNSPHRLVWCLRGEHGEATGRRHFHALLDGLPDNARHSQTCFWLMHTWEKVCHGGHARVRLYEPGLDGVGYVLKDLAGPDAYESAKFDSRSANLTLSEGLQRVLAALSRAGDRRLAQQQRRLVRLADSEEFATAGSGAPDVSGL